MLGWRDQADQGRLQVSEEMRLEVTARLVGRNVDYLTLMMSLLSDFDIFGKTQDAHGSLVLRMTVAESDAEQACRAVTQRLLSFSPTLVVHDVRPGPYEEIGDDDDAEEVRLDEFLARLDPGTVPEVVRRLSLI